MDINDVWKLCYPVQGGDEHYSFCYCCSIKVFRYFLQAPSVENTWSPATVIPRKIIGGVFMCNFRICCSSCRYRRSGDILYMMSYEGSLAREERIITTERCMDVFIQKYNNNSNPRKPLLLSCHLKAVIPRPMGKCGTRDIFRRMKGEYHFNYGDKPVALPCGVVGLQFSFFRHNTFRIVDAQDNGDGLTVTVTFRIANTPSDLETKIRSLHLFHRSLETCTLKSQCVENISLHLEE